MRKVLIVAVAFVFVLGFVGLLSAQKLERKDQPKPEPKAEPPKAVKALPESDRKFITEAAKGGIFEVEMGKVAADKASNEEVKRFAQRMVEDHSKANDELMQLANQKGVTVPKELDKEHREKVDRLSKVSGAQFDKAYMDEMVKDHKKDLSLFQKEAKDGKDPDVKSFASKTVPVLEEHFKMAQDLSKKTGGGAAPKKK
jgi:putative membrane protein